jgi:DNA-binding NtrC family response regulator
MRDFGTVFALIPWCLEVIGNFSQSGGDVQRKILLVTTVDEAYHQLLLKAQGYDVEKSNRKEADKVLSSDNFDVVVVTPDGNVEDTLAFCDETRRRHPRMRIVLIARRAEYVPPNSAVDAIIREQSTPAKFLSTIKTTLESPAEKGQAATIPMDDGEE